MSGGLNLSIRVENLDAVREQLQRLSGPQARQAYASALNDTGHHVRREMGKALRGAFDRPTPYIVNSPKFVAATPDKLSLSVRPTQDARNLPSKGGKAGVDQQKILQAQEFGGARADKKSEAILRRAGLLPAGLQAVIPREPFPGSEDGHGNIDGKFLRSVLSYLQTFGEVGYKANMTKKSQANVREFGKARVSKAQREQAGPRMGRRYFVAMGKWRDGRAGNLPPGIWAQLGASGAIVKPVLMFVRAARYTPRISMERIAAQADVQAYLDKRVRFRIREAAGV